MNINLNYTGAEKLHAQTSWGDRESEQRFIVKELCVEGASL